MKKSKSLRSSYLLVLLAGCFGYANAAPYGHEGREIKWSQPGGEQLTLRVFGDEYYARTEMLDGHTVTYNPEDGAYYYAGISADGSRLVPSGIKADQPAKPTLAKHLDLPLAQIKASSKARHDKLDADRKQRWSERVSAYQTIRAAQNGGNIPQTAVMAAAKVQAAPVTGDKIGLTVLVQFPNDSRTTAVDPINFPTDQAKIVRYCNGVGYTEDGNTGSVRDYFSDQSLGRLNYTQSVTPVVTMPRARNYYNFSDYPTNRRLRGDSGDLLLTDAIAELKKANFDFSNLTTDDSDRVIATNVFFAGQDSGVWAQGLWPYSTSLGTRINVGTVAKPIYISRYQQTNIDDSSPVIGTFCHENGHLLMGYSDLYDYGGESEGVGDHCLMGGGNYNNNGKTPSPINAYFKDIVGWGNVVDLAASDSNQTSLPTTGNVAYRISKTGADTEYFIVENRGDGDKWAQYAVDKGIAIWHIDEAKSGDDEEQMTSASHYEVSIEQADSTFDLENGLNRGDKSDFFDLTKSIFSDTTKPDAKWWDGTKSDIKLQVLGAVGASTLVQFGPIPPNTIIVNNPNGGEVIFPVSTFVVNWDANISGNVKIDLYKGGVLHSVLAANEPNSGRFVWVVPSTLPLGSDYKLKITSLTNAVPTSDLSDAVFSVSNTHFPANDTMPYGWSKPSSADVGWSVTNSTAYEGTYCLVNKPLADGKTAAVAYKSDFYAGNVSFYMKVSCEKGFDYGRFYIDGVAQDTPKEVGTKGLTGQVNWVFLSYPITAGTHTLKWSYSKDDSYTSGKDTAWLDGVSLPRTTQEIAVEQPAGTDLVDGKALVAFADTATDALSTAQVFTIKNVGLADLTSLRIITSGVNSTEFTVGLPGKKALAPGASTTFEVVFAPRTIGKKSAEIQILSNDEDEPAFSIALEGTALGVPKIAVFQPSSTELKDEKSLIKFGYSDVKTEGKTRKFTITNSGTATLSGLALGLKGANPGDFLVGTLGVDSLAPGSSTTFTVTFKPSRKDERTAGLRIASNDTRTGPFNIQLSGIGAPNQLAAPVLAAQQAVSPSLVEAVLGKDDLKVARNAPAVVALEVIDGKKYLSLTVTKPPGTGGLVRTVEVSSNLLDWYSGKRHTTVLLNDATTLKVRDNTPTSPGAKRYIHVKVTRP